MLSGTVPVALGALGRLSKCWCYRMVSMQSGVLYLTVFNRRASIDTIRVDSNALTGDVPEPVCVSFSFSRPLFYADCPDEIQCDCCTYCCTDNQCTCVHTGTDLEYLC